MQLPRTSGSQDCSVAIASDKDHHDHSADAPDSVEAHTLSDQANAGDGGRKRRSFIEAAELYQAIVPMPGSAVEIRPGAKPDDPLPMSGPPAIPEPPRSPALVMPPAPVALKPRAEPATEPAPVSEPTPRPVPLRAPPVQEATAWSAVAPSASPMQPRRMRLWPLAALLMLVAAGAAALWVERAQLASVTHRAAPRLLASVEPTPPPADAPVPRAANPAETTPEPAPPVAPQTVPPAPAPETPAAVAPASPPVNPPAAPAAAPAETAPKPTPTAPLVAPETPPEKPVETPVQTPAEAPVQTTAEAPVQTPAEKPAETPAATPIAGPQSSSPTSATPEPPAPEPTAAEPAAPAPKPDATPAPTPAPAALPAAALPAPSESQPQAPDAAPARKDWQVVIYYHAASPAAEAEAARLTAQMAPLTARVNMWQASAVPHLPAIVYFHPEDAAAAQDLAAILGPPAETADWHVRALPPPRTRRPPGTFEVWLAVP